jgi:hypothetical protein
VSAPPRRRDQGAALPLVLVMMVIATLIVIPVLNYAVAVLRANTVVSDKVNDSDAVKGAARIALADPGLLFNLCTNTAATTPVPTMQLTTSVTSQCSLVSETGAVAAVDIPLHAVSLQPGSSVPQQLTDPSQLLWPAVGATDAAWWTPSSRVNATPGQIWMPELPPTFEFNDPTEARAYLLPASYNGCKVYFPGRYTSRVVLDGPTYFASGNYYFDDEVYVVGGADVVVGGGLVQGCVKDQDAVYDVLNRPSTFNVSGLGGTWVFGDDGRLIIDNTISAVATNGTTTPNTANKALSLRFNLRYAPEPPVGATQPEGTSRVSIASVNGDLNGSTIGDLNVVGVVSVPKSTVRVSSTTGATDLASYDYQPSLHTAEPRVPISPTIVSATPLWNPAGTPSTSRGAVRVTWTPLTTDQMRGSLVTQYSVVATPGGQSCTTTGASCVIRGLANNVSHTLSLTATNVPGSSAPVTTSVTTPTGPTASNQLTVPGAPLNPVVATAPSEIFNNAVTVSWAPPATDGNAPITKYTVRAVRVWDEWTWPALGTQPDPLVTPPTLSNQVDPAPVGTCSTSSNREVAPATKCVVTGTGAFASTGLTPLSTVPVVDTVARKITIFKGYRFDVVAENSVALTGAASAPTTPVLSFAGAPYVAPPAPTAPVVPTFRPLALVDVRTTGAAPATVQIPGYIAAPQGRLSVNNTGNQNVQLTGGMVTGTMDIAPATGAPGSLPIGFRNQVIMQRTIRLVSRANNATSTMVVQINANSLDFRVNSWVIE